MKKTVIEFKDFSFQYHAQADPTLHHIDLTIYEGEKVLIIGPSGSGKSTLSHCINGMVPFYYKGEMTGSLKVLGKETKEMSIFELADKVGTVLQDPDGQFIGLTVAEDIAFKLENDCVSQLEMKKRVEEASKLVGIKSHLNKTPQYLSGGQKQRATLAGVLVNDVEIVLFDEPLASLDPATGSRAIELIDALKEETQKTVIIIEHRLEEVLHRNVDRIILVSEGRIIADTTPAQLLSSSLLMENGIREPLYLTALKYAGCHIEENSQPQQMNTLLMNQCKAQMRKWVGEIQLEEKQISKETILAFEDVSFGYDKKDKILKNLSFKVQKGEMLSIVGQNGAGKSTLSKLICGFYKPDSGRILFQGKDMLGDTIKERAMKIGMVMQNPNQMISKPMIFDEVAFGLRIRGVNEEEVTKRVHETLEVCGLYPFRKWPISALSYGQKKRVTIASILVLRPEVMILDEPTAGQDFKHYTEMMEFLRKLNEQGMTIIMITHDMHLMLEYTDRAIVLANGEKIADATGAEVLTSPEIIEVAQLRETSLYRLAVEMELPNPKSFVQRFIQFDRRERAKCSKLS
ncbi:MAG: ABC transporter ATP-binding protein [Cellulosilyticum sp.]|nr:ABC transporter ATP-binding protein [Cellulosilyticum sp.]